MKNILFTVALLLAAIAVQAQKTPEMKKDVADIRKMYAEAKQEMARPIRPCGQAQFVKSFFNSPIIVYDKIILQSYAK